MDAIKTIVKPSYYDEFSCLGKDCRYDCCREWRISVGRKEYTKIRSLPLCRDKERGGQRVFKRHRSQENQSVYAELTLNDQGLCPFLNEERLCSLQLAHGHTILPRTCQQFPRIAGRMGDVLSLHLSLGCEKVLKLLFQHPQGIAFVEMDGSRWKGNVRLSWEGDEEKMAERPVYRFEREITLMSLYLLQRRSLSLDDRMLLLGMVLEKLGKWEEEGKPEEIPGYLKRTMEEVEAGALESLFDKVKGDRRKQAVNAAKMMELFFKGAGRDAFLKRVRNNLGIELKLEAREHGLYEHVHIDTTQLKRAEQRLASFLEGWEYILENICVTWFSQMHMPFYMEDKTIFENYLLFAALYHMLKYLVTGYLEEENTTEDFLYAVTVCSRTLTHSSLTVRRLLDHLLKNGVDSLAHIAILVK